MKHLFGKDKGEEHNFWMSYTDLMSGFLIVFIICSIVTYNNYSEKKKECERQLDSIRYLSSLKNQILEYKDIFLETDEIKVSFDTQRGSIVLTHKDPSKDLFGKGKHEVKSPLKEYLDNIYIGLVRKTMKLDTMYNNIELRIEGHTDPTWNTGVYERGSDSSFLENLKLSTNRANAVYKQIYNGKELSNEERDFVKKNMISIGYSFSERVEKNNVGKEYEYLDPSSRRIEFRIISK